MARLQRARLVACGFKWRFELMCVSASVFMYLHACTCVLMHTEVMEQHWAPLLFGVGHFVF